MQADGQTYFGPEGEIPDEDIQRLRRERMALARVGLDALIDEATGYQELRPADELRSRYARYKQS